MARKAAFVNDKVLYDTLAEEAARRRGHVRWKGERSAQ